MTYFVEDNGKVQKVFRTQVVEPKKMSVLNSDLSVKIMHELSKKPQCAMDVARRLKEHEQKIYYHFRRLESAGIIKFDRNVERAGAVAKMYSITHPYLTVKLYDGDEVADVKRRVKEIDFFKPFIRDGKLDATIVIGSHEKHGKYGVGAYDGTVGIDLALMLGSMVTSVKPAYKLDTEVREKDLNGNMILIGGPKANMLIDKMNKELPVYFDSSREFDIVSSKTKSIYSEEGDGIIVKMKNPNNPEKSILVLSGKRFMGTKSAVVALMKDIGEVSRDSEKDGSVSRVVRGIDRNSDGIIDDVEFLE